MDPSGVQAARQTSLAEKKRRMKSPTQQVSAPNRVKIITRYIKKSLIGKCFL